MKRRGGCGGDGAESSDRDSTTRRTPNDAWRKECGSDGTYITDVLARPGAEIMDETCLAKRRDILKKKTCNEPDCRFNFCLGVSIAKSTFISTSIHLFKYANKFHGEVGRGSIVARHNHTHGLFGGVYGIAVSVQGAI